MKKTTENFKELLHEKGFKATPARLAILTIFSGDCNIMSAEDVHKKIAKSRIDLVTVYRTLTAFEKTGLLKKVDVRKESVYYELAAHHHHHIVCKECGSMEEFDICEIDILSKKILNKSSKFKKVIEHSFELLAFAMRV